MRSVLVHLRDASPPDVTALLQRVYPLQLGPPWIAGTREAPVLYIERYADLHEYEPEHLAALVSRLGRAPSVSVVANVSGRVDGTAEVRAFVRTLLGAFDGVADDTLSERFWTLDEMEHVEEGRGFFDYRRQADG